MATPTVDFIHPSYKAHRHQVELVNDIYNGIDTAKLLLLQLRNEPDDKFVERQDSATLDNYIERITTVMSGKVMRKAIAYEDISDAIIDSLDTVSADEDIIIP